MKSKKLLSIATMLTCFGGSVAVAKTVDLTTAKQTGFHFMTNRIGSSVMANKNALTLAYTATGATSGQPCYYIFNVSHGFVIVSAEDAVKPILAFSNETQFNTSKIPHSTQYLLDGYTKQIDNIKTTNTPATAEVAQKWSNLNTPTNPKSTDRTTSVVVGPLLGSLIWDQAPYYNDSCPNDVVGGGLSVTGCVATATAQVMKYWSWPSQGVGTHTYTTATRGFTCSANFGAATYNWTAMPNSISAHNTAIAQLMYHVGVAVDMDYTAAESGAYVISAATGTPPNCAQYALTQYFKYDATSIQGLSRSSYADAAWYSLITTDLSAGRPVIYSGSGSAGGHCWVLDGYDDTLGTNYFHCNWGWSGTGPDGFYSVDNMNPPALGTGGGGGGFDSSQAAIFGIKPNIFPITGTLTVCQTHTTTLADATSGGTWTSGTTSVATVSSAGVVTGVAAGTSVITYNVSGNSVYATVTVNPLPNAGTITGGATAICLGGTATLTDAATGGTWSSTSTGVATVSGGIVSAVTGGSATIDYSVTNSCGTAVASTTITVNNAPAITATPTLTPPTSNPCVGGTSSYSASCTGATSFVWTVLGTGWSGTSTTSALTATAGSGTGTIEVQGNNACGAGPMYTYTVTPDNTPAVPTVTMSGTLPCTGATSATYNAASTGATSYTWAVIGTGWSGSSTTSAINVTLGTGSATLICTANNHCGASRADTNTISSSPLPVTPIVNLTSAFPCAGTTSATYTATSLGALTYNWTVTGTGWSGTSTTGTLNVTIGTGTGTIVCTGVNACGSGTATTVTLTPATPVSAATAISSVGSICSGTAAEFTTPAIAGATSYVWTVSGTGWSGSSTTATLSATAGTGPGTITVAGVGPCGTGAPFTLSSVTPSISPSANFSLGAHTESVGSNDLLTYTGSSTSSSATYSWNFAGGSASPGVGVGPHLVSWATPGLKTVSLIVIDGGCASAAYSDTVMVGSTTGLESVAANTEMTIVPNPNTGVFEIVFGNATAKSVTVKIADMEGRIVFTNKYENVNGSSVKVNVSQLPNAVYLATITTDGNTANRKIIINR